MSYPDESVLAYPERIEFREAEERIERGLANFVQVGRDLERIRVCEWWREKYTSFNAYLLERWGFTSRHGNNLIAAAGVVSNAQTQAGEPMVPLPENERQARAIAGLEPDEQRQALIEGNAEGPPSAARLAEIAARLRGSRGIALEPTVAEIKREEAGIHQRAQRDDRVEGLRKIVKLSEKLERCFGVLDSGEQDLLAETWGPFKAALASLG